jgi:stage II sporulation protein D
MQPPEILREGDALESTIHHELLHMLIESYARPGTPLWFREGLVLYLSSPDAGSHGGPSNVDVTALGKTLRAPPSEQALREAYVEAEARVAQLARQHGKDTLLDWLQNGLPADASGSFASVR